MSGLDYQRDLAVLRIYRLVGLFMLVVQLGFLWSLMDSFAYDADQALRRNIVMVSIEIPDNCRKVLCFAR